MSALGAQPATASDVDMEASGVEPIAPPGSVNAAAPLTPPADSWALRVEANKAMQKSFNDLLCHVSNNARALAKTVCQILAHLNPATYLDDFTQVATMLTTTCRELHTELLVDPVLNNSNIGTAALCIFDHFFTTSDPL
ncbi:uncharacterized protein LAESUDRAFT_754717 [Laetiporus sulphureus 93-53]|uniref:Uncharacterized protein n=1 Tax=Laetiporus sulphureus 93-53 TaxID=1314785 RepID=A0A165HV28_9APHY|nr:uncharacterized protein LAESUDRAFT_754717 [Laetiporus sulphureus 93-53]KZT12227.1 hypothetical protein LAESUDRAFT_754717 [Laetiporus sulphureus 93-53]